MTRCPACSGDAPEGSRFCPGCGASLDEVSATATRTSAAAHARGLSTDTSYHGSFLPGTLLAGRYRMLGLLGRGGMGEVYRADDLKLGQAVALKFLPAAAEQDVARLQRFLNEVKIARQISHPGVCRVYDVDEVDGHHFLSMEYVDGEDLASLLRRIGRLPNDKAVQISRQLCAGLAAAHDQGILHRDLKPANVMIDGRGRAKIADFGLAALAGEIGGAEAFAGTPAYMAPEQRAGKGVSVRSDLYSLGLVLYELFTGRPAFDAASAGELQPTRPSTLVEGLDPAVERVILRCLEADARERPATALAVAAALPGGDPLAAALAAGETPSPEMVAAAGGEGTLGTGTAFAFLAFTLGGLALCAFIAGRTTLVGLGALEKPPEVLSEKAREILARVGYTEPAADTAHRFVTDSDRLQWDERSGPAPDRWSRLARGRPSALLFWYRESPRRFEPVNPEGVVRYLDPPPMISGMTSVLLDPRGRLLALHAVPPQVEEAAGSAAEPDWSRLFAAAELDLASFRSVEPRWTPLHYADRRAAWEGTLPEGPGAPLRVEAAAYRGRPVSFQIVWPWSRPARMQPFQAPAGLELGLTLSAIFLSMVLVGAVVLARRNLLTGRGDRKGSLRLGVYLFIVGLLGTLLEADHVPSASREWARFGLAAGEALFVAGFVWLLYLALEPFVRRRWPQGIIAWTRLLAGRFRDPRVGREILAGAAGGVAIALAERLYYLVPPWLGVAGPIAPSRNLGVLLGTRHLASGLLDAQIEAVLFGMQLLFFLFMGIGPMKRAWPGILIFFGMTTLMNFLFLGGGAWPLRLGVSLLWAVLVTGLLTRFGLLATIVALLCRIVALWVAFDWSAWHAEATLASWLVVLSLAGYGFYTSLGGRWMRSPVRPGAPPRPETRH